MQRFLIALGVLLIAVGVSWPWLAKLPWGRLPGDISIEREGSETVGGFLLSHLGHVPTIGEAFDIDGLHVEVIDAERRRVRKVRITRASPQEDREIEKIGHARE